MSVNPIALFGALLRVLQSLLRPARAAAKVSIGATRDLTRTRSELLAENALLRHQVIVLRRGVRRPWIHSDDRLLSPRSQPANQECKWMDNTSTQHGSPVCEGAESRLDRSHH